MTFSVGQKVVCINALWGCPSSWDLVPNKPVINGVYTVRAVGCETYRCEPAYEVKPAIWLDECVNPLKQWRDTRAPREIGFWVGRFRPLEEKSDAIEVFRQMCKDAESGKLVGA